MLGYRFTKYELNISAGDLKECGGSKKTVFHNIDDDLNVIDYVDDVDGGDVYHGDDDDDDYDDYDDDEDKHDYGHNDDDEGEYDDEYNDDDEE